MRIRCICFPLDQTDPADLLPLDFTASHIRPLCSVSTVIQRAARQAVWDAQKSHSNYQCGSLQQVFCEGEDQTICMLELYCLENLLTLSSSCVIFLIFKCTVLTNKCSSGLQTYSLNGDEIVTKAKTLIMYKSLQKWVELTSHRAQLLRFQEISFQISSQFLQPPIKILPFNEFLFYWGWKQEATASTLPLKATEDQREIQEVTVGLAAAKESVGVAVAAVLSSELHCFYIKRIPKYRQRRLF